jgi:hypothetical protein
MRDRLLWLAALAATAATLPAAAQSRDGAVAETLRRAGVTPTENLLRGGDAKTRDAAIERLARSYDLPAEVLNARDRVPDNPKAIMDRLGLVPRDGAERTDLSRRTPPTPQEIFDALAPR